MILDLFKSNRMVAIVALLLAAIIIISPYTAHAQDECADGGDFYTSYGSSMTNMAQRHTQIHKNFLDNSITIDISMYCIDTLIQAVGLLNTLMTATDLYYAIFSGVINIILQALVNFACAILTQVLTLLQHSLFLQFCLPLPQLHLGLNLPNYGNQCISLPGLRGMPVGGIGLAPMGMPPAPANRTQWQIWTGANGKFQTYQPPAQ